MKKVYSTVNSETSRKFTDAELKATANGIALIIDDADFGYMAIIPLKNKKYPNMRLSSTAIDKSGSGMVIQLSEARILIETCTVIYSNGTSDTIRGEEFLDF